MLREVVLLDPDAEASWPLTRDLAPFAEGSTTREALQAYFAWKNEFEPMSWRACGRCDLEIVGEWSLQPPQILADAAARRVTIRVPAGDPFAHLDACNHVAREVRDVLLGRKPLCDWQLFLGDPRWPFAQSSTAPGMGRRRRSPLSGSHLMVVGCGSVGSELVRSLSNVVRRWTLVDGGRVSVFNPSRQWFGTSEVGQFKVEALARRFPKGTVRTLPRSLGADDLPELEGLLAESRPDLVVLATGTEQDAAIAPALWRAGIPHVVAYAYPQARFFEVTTVIPAERTPCAHCFRGNLYRGLESQAPVPDEVASFLYSRPDQERDRLYTNLVAEPATKIETSRISDVVARCAAEALSAPEHRSPWFARMLAEATTCLLGANVVEEREDGSHAYGITYPGQVIRLGLGDVTGVEERVTCERCGRQMRVAHRVELPRCDEDEADRAMLAAAAPAAR
jgi:hypothetical protein